MTRLLSSLALLLVAAGGAAQDSLQLTDGRFVTGPKMSAGPDGGVVLELQFGEILVPASLVKESTVVVPGAAAAELTAAEKKKVERGLVKFEGRWLSQKDLERAQDKRAKEIKEKISDAATHSKWENRYEHESKHFKFQYTIDPDIMHWWADLMDGYYDTFAKFWGGIKRPPGQPKLDVKFFHSKDYFDQVTGATTAAGFFRFVPPLELDFYYERLDQDYTMNVMFHEANHYLVWLMAPGYRYPNWLNEGLAEYYGASIWDPEKKKLEVGGLLEGRLAGVQQDILKGDWVTLEDMMPYPNIPGQYYGWAWSFVHFMLHSSKKNEKNFKRLVRGFPKDKSQDRERQMYPGSFQMEFHSPEAQVEIVKKFLKVKDLEKLQEEWHAYVEALEPASAEGYFAYGRFSLQDGMPIKATKMFEKALEMGLDLPKVYLAYAEALEKKPKKTQEARLNDYDRALAQIEKAIAIDPVNPLFRARYATLLNKMARAKEEANDEIIVQRGLAKELGDCVDGGAESYSVFLSLDWDVYKSEESKKGTTNASR